ncbi:unnamed protein product [Candida verbasci]|uniref:Uncharacterized protein n=1 Tax=Candida verbasci TaxID=1227364 RepID=A0A9W4TZ68_9ASCO|nr:unnamed protein product [Candida verbasci]
MSNNKQVDTIINKLLNEQEERETKQPSDKQVQEIIQDQSTSKNLLKTNPSTQKSLVPPLNFSLVEDGIYRSGFPMPINYQFLQKLKLKTIIYLGDLSIKKSKDKNKNGSVDILNNYLKWIDTTNIQFHNLLIESSQEPFNKLEENDQALKSLTIALQLILNKKHYPILIHSNKGKHRTGLLVGLMRKLLQGWCLSGIFEEYEKFAMGKSEYDLELIELWQPELWIDDNDKPEFVRT